MTIRTAFRDDLERLRHDILAMSSQVQDALARAMLSLKNQDVELARMVKSGDEAIDAMQRSIEDEAAILIATQQPVARDLRELVTVFKVTYNLERAGDYAKHLAKTAIKLAGEPSFRHVARLETMAETGGRMLRQTVEAYLAQDAGAARMAAAMDDEIDHEHKKLVEETLSLMRERSDLVERASRLLTTSGYLERFGDHVTNMCEAIVYMVEGRHSDLNN